MDIILFDKRCKFCKREATLLGDVIVGEYVGHPPKGVDSIKVTCDNKICDKCAKKLKNMHICPSCIKSLN